MVALTVAEIADQLGFSSPPISPPRSADSLAAVPLRFADTGCTRLSGSNAPAEMPKPTSGIFQKV